jgi:hypothetical protein
MRLLSFCNLVETTLAMLQPDHAEGWSRRADYQLGTATCWHPDLGLSVSLQCCALEDGRSSLQARWHGPSGEVLHDRTFFCGTSSFEWQRAAEAVAEAMPEPVLSAPAARAIEAARRDAALA